MPSLIADGLCVRPLRRHDAEAGQWLQVCEDDLESGAAYSMGIFSEDGELFIGGIRINGIDREHNFAQVGFRVLRLTRLEIVIQEDNHGSRRVAQKAGAGFDGLLKNRLVVRGTPYTAA